MATKNVLVSVVGDRDPLDHERFNPDNIDSFASDLCLDPGPILETIYMFDTDSTYAKTPLDKVWLLYTDDNSNKKIKSRVEWLCAFLKNKNIETIAYDLQVTNPSDYSLLIPSMSIASSHIRRANEGSNFFILTSPGTPQMSATWIVLGNEGRLPGTFLQKVPGKRVYEGSPGRSRVISRHNDGLLLPITLSPFFEHEKIKQIALLLTKHLAFSSCSLLLTEIADQTLFVDRVPYYHALRSFCDIITAWENSDYKSALKMAEQQKGVLKPILSVANPKLYQNVVNSLTLLNKPSGTHDVLLERVKNLVARSARSHAKGDFAACVNAAFSAYETLLAGTLQNPPYSFNDFDKGYTQDKEDRLLGKEYEYGKSQKCAGANPKHEGMSKIKGQPGFRSPSRMPAAYALVTNLRNKRNGIVHSNEQVDGPQAEKLLMDTIRIISTFLNKPEEDLTLFPYSPSLGAEVASVALTIAKLF